MTLQIEEGKFYRARNGRKFGPLKEVTDRGQFSFIDPEAIESYRPDGTWCLDEGDESDMDLVAEWVDGPAGFTPEQEAKLANAIGEHHARKAEQQKAEPGWKMDAGKARIDLMAPEMVYGVANVLAFGAAKYSERNWEKGMSWGRCFGAMMRHLWSWWAGERNDPESGWPHLAHAACCLMFLMAYEARQIGTDDRKLPVDKPSEM